MFLDWLFTPVSHQYEARRVELLNKIDKNNNLYAFLSVPMPALNSELSSVEIVSVDFETTGLDAVKDKLLSIGCVNMAQGQIQLGSCFHEIIAIEQPLSADNVAIHTITDNETQNGKSLKQVFDAFLMKIAGKVLLVHFNQIEREFIKQACIELYGVAPVIPMIDTLCLAKKEFARQDFPFDPQDLTLENLRKRAQLPFYQQHHALSDAIATAELYLTMIKPKCAANMQLKDVLI
ncbi:exonuclease domain-containing protein [Psychrosphaera sp. F3M07]|uniref:exonuclease domain-containing protein n=1 Tax=Psychrosphaera sp. F3M07 TaxID=2841560 RepID=UPI00353055B9